MPVLLYEKKDKTGYITLNRPPLNTMSRLLSRVLISTLHDIDEDPNILVGIITGTGDRSFCAGADLADMEHMEASQEWEADYVWQLTSVKKPLIAAVNGYCLGAGLTLALSCDIKIASDTASFGTPDQKLNTIDCYASLMLSHLIPSAIAMEILMTGDPISAQEAYRLGLVSNVVPPGELMPTAESLAKKICGNGPLALWACKELNKRTRTMTLEDGLCLFKSLAGPILKSEDTKEGISAFFEKRSPVWKCK
jgi:enoyl-CoA hydratase/carnithine racemase